jgi:hypothetical protein
MRSNTPTHTFRGPITLDTLDDLFDHHRRQFGGWSMEGDGGDGGSGGGTGGAGGSGDGGGQGGGAGGGADGGSGSGGSSSGGTQAATDAQGNDLGFPKDTPVAEMTDKQATAYWKHKARKHEGRVSELVGDRTPEQVKQDLAELAELKKAQQTPAEQALTEAREEGKKEATAAERAKTAAAIFKGALEAHKVDESDIEELVTNFNVAGYITDDGVDTTKITNFAKKFAPSGKDTSSTRRRDFGGGSRTDDGQHSRGSGGKAEAERRFGKKDKQTA